MYQLIQSKEVQHYNVSFTVCLRLIVVVVVSCYLVTAVVV